MAWVGLQEVGRMVRNRQLYFSDLKPHPSGRAVVVIDMLNDFLRKDGSLSMKEVRSIIAANNRVIDSARREGIPVIYVCEGHTYNDPEFEQFPRHGVRRTWGAQLHPKMSQPQRRKEWIFKTGFSGFGMNRNKETRLNAVLTHLKVREIVLVGVATEFCDKFTALAGIEKDYSVKVVSDAIKSIDINEGDGAAAIDEMGQAGVQFILSGEAEALFAGGR